MHIVTGSDHAGFELKRSLIDHLEALGHTVTDKGTLKKERCDYPDYAAVVAGSVASGEADCGVLVCGTGIGMAMSANKVSGIRAAVVSDVFSARATRQHKAH